MIIIYIQIRIVRVEERERERMSDFLYISLLYTN